MIKRVVYSLVGFRSYLRSTQNAVRGACKRDYAKRLLPRVRSCYSAFIRWGVLFVFCSQSRTTRVGQPRKAGPTLYRTPTPHQSTAWHPVQILPGTIQPPAQRVSNAGPFPRVIRHRRAWAISAWSAAKQGRIGPLFGSTCDHMIRFLKIPGTSSRAGMTVDTYSALSAASSTTLCIICASTIRNTSASVSSNVPSARTL